MKLRLLVCALPLVLAASALAQNANARSAEPKAATTLNQVAESLLNDPTTLAAIEVSKEQLERALLRASLEPLRELAKRGGSLKGHELSFTVPQVVIGDLSAAQRQKLRRIALNEKVLDALLTDEVTSTLGVTDAQRKALEQIRSKAYEAASQVMLAAPELKKLQAIAAGIPRFDDADTKMTSAQIDAAFDSLAEALPQAMALVNAKVDPLYRDADRKALDVLTPTQRRELEKMQR